MVVMRRWGGVREAQCTGTEGGREGESQETAVNKDDIKRVSQAKCAKAGSVASHNNGGGGGRGDTCMHGKHACMLASTLRI